VIALIFEVTGLIFMSEEIIFSGKKVTLITTSAKKAKCHQVQLREHLLKHGYLLTY
jgi:hypothetical protein